MFSDPPKWLCAPQRQTLWLVPPAINFHCLVWSRCLINVSCIWFSVHEKMWKITEDSLWQKHTRLLQSPGQDGSQTNLNDTQGQPSRYLRHLQTIVPNCLVGAEWNNQELKDTWRCHTGHRNVITLKIKGIKDCNIIFLKATIVEAEVYCQMPPVCWFHQHTT